MSVYYPSFKPNKLNNPNNPSNINNSNESNTNNPSLLLELKILNLQTIFNHPTIFKCPWLYFRQFLKPC